MTLHRRAFTLIELALVLVIVSLMTGFGMQAVEGTASVNCYELTQTQLETIDGALKNYAANNRRFPKPAYMNLGSTDPNFGREATDGVGAANNTPAYGTAVPTGMTENSGVLIGALPHATLGLSAQYAADCWGDKFTYAVVNTQTSSDNSAGYTSGAQGTIQLRGGTLVSPVPLATNAVYVVLSHGQDKYGATALTTNNTTAKNCNGSSASKIDRENCNSDAIFYNAMRSTGNTANYFDDMLVFSQKTQSTEDCPGQTVNWGPSNTCTASSPMVTHTNSASVTNTTTNWTGHANLSCHDGVLTVTEVDCFPSAPCPPQTASWGGSCSGAVSSTVVHGQSPAVSINNSAVNRMGSTYVSCNNGTLTYPGPSTCNPAPACNPASIAWGPGNACTASLGSMTAGQVSSGVANTTSWYAGSTDVECRNTTNGTGPSEFVLSNSSCVSTPPSPCSAQSVSWGGCTGTAPAMAHNGSAGVTDSDPMKTGTGTASCYNGVATATGSCNNDCAGTTVNWGVGCSASFPQIAGNGGSSTQANTAPGYTGSLTVSCTNGTPTQSGASCATVVHGTCGSANGASTLTAPSTNLCNSGTPTGVSGSGPWSWDCQGASGGNTVSCTGNRSCTGSASWGGSCAGTYGTMPHGNSTSLANSNAGFTGNTNVACNQGTPNLSGSVCNPAAPSGCYNNFEVFATYYYGSAGESLSVNCPAGQGADEYGYTDNSNPWKGYAWWTSNVCEVCPPTCTPAADGQPPANPCGCQNADTDGNGQCGFQCRADGQSSSGNPALCCNGDSDGNGTCGTQGGGGCSAAAQAAMEAACPTYNSSGVTDGSSGGWEDCQPCGAGAVATCREYMWHSEYGNWEETQETWKHMAWDGVSGSATVDGGNYCTTVNRWNGHPGGNGTDNYGNCPWGGAVCGGGPPCTGDGSPPGGGGCCNADTDGNGLCGFQCRADGQSSSGNPALCCNGDSDGNGTCGTQAACISDGNPPGGGTCCNGDSDGNGLCGFQPMDPCAAQGLSEGEGNYDAGSCTLTSCCSGTVVTSNPSPCPMASYMGGAAQCSGGGGGQPAGSIVGSYGGDLVCFNGLWGANYNCNCTPDYAACASGTGHAEFFQNTGGCPGTPDCSNGDTQSMADCSEGCNCVCN